MRSTTTAEDRILALHSRATYTRVRIDRGDDVFVDMTDLDGHNWLVSAAIDQSVDKPVAVATAKFKRAIHDLTLSPLMIGSKLNSAGVIVDLNNTIVVETATMPEHQPPVEADWVERFRGGIDEIAWQRDPLEIRCRDLGRNLQDRWIETPSELAGGAIQTVIQVQILDSVFGVGADKVTLFSINGTGGDPFKAGDSPGFSLNPYVQQPMPIMEAIKTLVNLIGWDVRYRWQNNVDSFEFVLYEPGRDQRARGTLALTGIPLNNETFVINGTTVTAKTSGAGTDEFNIASDAANTASNIVFAIEEGSEKNNVSAFIDVSANVTFEWQAAGAVGNSIVFTEGLTNATMDGGGTLGGTRTGTDASSIKTFDKSRVVGISKAAITLADIRNVVRVRYGIKPVDRATVEVVDAASVAKYGRRFVDIAEDASSQIDIAGEARDFANAIMDDLKEPNVAQDIVLQDYWPIQGNDIITTEANGIHYDADIETAIIGIKSEFTLEQHRMSLRTRGQPSAGVNRWLDMVARPGLAPGLDFAAVPTPTISPIISDLAGFYCGVTDPLEFDPPLYDWDQTEIHASTTPGFTPSAATLVASSRGTWFEVQFLIPATTYYVRAVFTDLSGNRSPASVQVSVLTQEVGAYHTNADDNRANMVPNGNFGNSTLPIADNPPDRITMEGATWGGAADIFQSVTVTKVGPRSIHFINAGASGSAFLTDFIPILDEKYYEVVFYLRASSIAAGKNVQFGVRAFDKDKVQVGVDLSYNGLNPLSAANVWIVERHPTDFSATFHYFSSNDSVVKFVRFFVEKNGTAFDLYCGAIELQPAQQQFAAYRANALNIAVGIDKIIVFDITDHDRGKDSFGGVAYGYNSGNGRYTALEPGKYSFRAVLALDAFPANVSCRVGFYFNGAQTKIGSENIVPIPGDVRLLATHQFDMVKDDYVQVFGAHSGGAGITVLVGSINTFFSGERVL